MAGCSNDKKKAFLTKTSSRIKNRLQEAERAEQNRLNRLQGKTKFEARILAFSSQETAVNIESSETNDELERIVIVRVFELDSAILDPGGSLFKGKDKQGRTLRLITNHDIAYAPSSMALKVGDIVIVEFADPPISDSNRFSNSLIEVVQRVSSDEEYQTRLLQNLAGDDYASLISYDNASSVDDDDLYVPRKRTHVDGDVLHNGRFSEWEEYLDVLTDDGTAITHKFASGTIIGTQLKQSDRTTLASETTVNTITFSLSEITSAPEVGSFVSFGLTYAKEPISEQLRRFAIKHYEAWGTGLIIISMGRSFKKQKDLYNVYLGGCNKAAKPGRSNHGWLMAIDIYPIENKTKSQGQKDMTYGDKHTTWIIDNLAAETDLDNEEGRGVNEPWHMSVKTTQRVYIWK